MTENDKMLKMTEMIENDRKGPKSGINCGDWISIVLIGSLQNVSQFYGFLTTP